MMNSSNAQSAQLAAYNKAHPVPQVNAQKYENINTSRDGQFGTDGMWVGPNTGEFAVTLNDPLCK